MIVNQNIKLLIFQHDFNNVKFADLIGVTSQTVDNIVKKKNFNVDVINSIIKVYPNLNIDWLFTGRGAQWFFEKNDITPVFEEPQGTYDKKISILQQKNNQLLNENNELKNRVMELQKILLEKP